MAAESTDTSLVASKEWVFAFGVYLVLLNREVFENLFKTTPTLRADPLKVHSTDGPKPNP